MDEKLLSIITVTYNAESNLEKTIQSIIKIKKSYIEYIVIDGKSRDNTLKIINKYNDNIDTLIIEKDKGIYDAQNKGIKLSRGKYIIFIQAGDTIVGDNLNEIINIMKKEKPDMIYGNVRWNHTLYDGKFNKLKLCHHNICQQSIFYSVDKMLKYGCNNLDYNSLADYDLNLKYFGDKSNDIIYYDGIIANFEIPGYSANNPDNNFHGKRKWNIFRKRLGFFYFCIVVFIDVYRTAKKKLKLIVNVSPQGR